LIILFRLGRSYPVTSSDPDGSSEKSGSLEGLLSSQDENCRLRVVIHGASEIGEDARGSDAGEEGMSSAKLDSGSDGGEEGRAIGMDEGFQCKSVGRGSGSGGGGGGVVGGAGIRRDATGRVYDTTRWDATGGEVQ
jgi:hypothetical protein